MHVPSSIAPALAAAAALALSGCASSPDRPARSDERAMESMELGDVQSCYLCGDVYLGSLPDAAALELAARRGVRTLIDVTPLGFDAGFDVAERARELELGYLRVPLQPEGVSAQQVDQVLAALRDPTRGLTFLFGVTSGGPALLTGIWRTIDGGVELEAALEDARRVGMEPGACEDAFRAQVERLSEAEALEAAEILANPTIASAQATAS